MYPFKKLCFSKEKNGGYAGVGILAREKPLSIEYGINDENFDNQGRIIQVLFFFNFINYFFRLSLIIFFCLVCMYQTAGKNW